MKIGIMGAMTEEVGSLKEQMTDIHEEEHGRRVYIQGKISHIDVVVVF
jgi:nucleoside phosphorylase